MMTDEAQNEALATALGMIRARLAGDMEAEQELMAGSESGMDVFQAMIAMAAEGFVSVATLQDADPLDLVDTVILAMAGRR